MRRKLFLPNNGGRLHRSILARHRMRLPTSLRCRCAATSVSVTGNGQNLSFSVVGDGVVKVALPQAGDQVVVTGTGVTSYGVSPTDAKELDITLTGLGNMTCQSRSGRPPPTEFVTSVVFSPTAERARPTLSPTLQHRPYRAN